MLIAFDDCTTVAALKLFVDEWKHAIVKQYDVELFEVDEKYAEQVAKWLLAAKYRFENN